eukprot:2936845-Prymnesium_polylepis.1
MPSRRRTNVPTSPMTTPRRTSSSHTRLDGRNESDSTRCAQWMCAQPAYEHGVPVRVERSRTRRPHGSPLSAHGTGRVV